MDTTFYFRPQRKMRKGEKCWCLSGRRWKDCHMVREMLPPVTIEQVHDARKKGEQSITCLHPNAPCGCTGLPIRSHSIQKSASLKAISVKSHVSAFCLAPIGKMKNIESDDDVIQLTKLSINKASTFPGFCEKHDTELFRPVETEGWRHSKENALLFSLRSVSMELLKKKAAVSFNNWHMDHVDRGKSFEEQVDKQLLMRKICPSIEEGYKDVVKAYDDHKNIFKGKDYDRFNYLYFELKDPTPIVSCGIFAPEFDFAGERLQGYADEDLESVSLNLYNCNDRTICIVGYINGKKQVGDRFIDSLLNIPKDRISNVIIQLAFNCLENTFFNEKWYDDLSGDNKVILKEMIMHNSSPLQDTEMHFLRDSGWNVFDSPVTLLLDSRAESS